MDENKRIIEINGIKIEVDLRTAKRVDTYKVGDRVKVLIKKYSDTYTSHDGVIVDFAEFEKKPTITVCYVDDGYNADPVKFAYVYDGAEIELAPTNTEVPIEKATIMDRLNREITKAEQALDDLKVKRDYFIKHFGLYFKAE